MKFKDIFEAKLTKKQKEELNKILDNHPKREAGRTAQKRSDGLEEIYNPTIMDIERGNMVRVHIDRPPAHKNFRPYENQRDWGEIVLDIDYKRGLVLVGEYMGGSLEFSEWVPVDDIKVTWNIGGYEKAKETMSQFGGALNDMLDKRKNLERDSEIEKHVKFKRST